MFRNYLIVAVRNLVRHKIYSFINISGLAIGMAFCILTFLYVRNEWTYDTFHENADQIYRIYQITKSPTGGERYWATAPDPLASTLRNDYPELVVVRLNDRESWVTFGDKSFKEKVSFADPGIFEMFTFPLLKGNSETALNNMNSVVITEDLAAKYFGREDPMGKILTVDNQYDFIITGVLQKIPENSSIKFNMLVPARFQNHIDPDFEKRWWSNGTYTYIQCSEAFYPSELENQLPYIHDKYIPNFMKDRMRLGLQPLTSIHLDSHMISEMVPGNSTVYLYILSMIAFSVLLIACFNFMNLSTARYTERAKEIGMRKVLGAQRLQLIKQFLGEAIFLSLLSLIIGLALAELFLPEFNALVDKELGLDYHKDILTLVGLLGLGLLVGILAGSYPAFFLSAYQPVEVLKKQKKAHSGNVGFRRILIVTQFAISILLIVCELIVTQQVRYMKNQDLGFNLNHVVVIPTHTRSSDMKGMKDPLPKIKAYLNTIHARKERAGIVSASISENIPGRHFQNKFGVIPEGWKGRNSLEMIVTSIDEKFLETYQMQLVEGRNFSLEFSTDKNDAFLLNETAVKRIGWQTAIGKHIEYVHWPNHPFKVIGVVKDIHFKSLQNQIEPLVYRFAADKYKIDYISVRIRPENIPETLKFLEKQWRFIVQDIPFEYFFLGDEFSKSYQDEEKTANIIGIFSLLAILLACLGLFGLAALTVAQHTKEIGVRKVLGASISGIVLLLSKEFTKLVIVSNLIAWPVAYYAMNRWLQDFAYRIHIGVGTFLLAGVLALVIALLTVSFQAIKAALANPVEALRYE